VIATIIIILVLAVVVLIAVKSAKKRFSGDGSCCGGGGDEWVEEDKKLTNPKIAEKEVKIQGMSCENCKKRIQRQLDRIDGVSAKVDWKKGVAKISEDREVPDDTIRRTIERLDYKVVDIQSVPLSQE
jgi:copper chaperone